MSPRRRSKAKRGWPANLYERDGYFSWRHPLTREEHGLGRDRSHAFTEAIAANQYLASLVKRPSLVDRITGAVDRSVGAWAVEYAKLLARADLSDNTRKSYRSLLKRMVAMFGHDTPIASVTALEASRGLEALATVEGKARLAQALRNFMRDAFREARVQGWYTHDNPIMDTKLPIAVTVKRARLSLETFLALYEAERLDWARNAYALALTSAQRREDVCDAQFTAFRDGAWWCVQHSEKATDPHRIIIPLELKPRGFHLSLGDVLAQCRRTGVLSRYLVHQTKPRGNSPVGSQIWLDTLSRRFTATLETLRLDFAPKTPPTFHEIRSLAERLYSDQGVDTQALLGHNDAETTAIYHNNRGSEWVRVTTG